MWLDSAHPDPVCSYRDYAESVGRKVRDLGMVVDLIFLNTEVSLSQALEDVSRGGSPFAIVITQQHQIHRSCTVNIMFGTPQGTETQVVQIPRDSRQHTDSVTCL